MQTMNESSTVDLIIGRLTGVFEGTCALVVDVDAATVMVRQRLVMRTCYRVGYRIMYCGGYETIC